MNISELILHLNLIEGIGPATIDRIIAHKDHISQIYHYSAKELECFFQLSQIQAQKVYAGLSDKKLLERALQLLEMHKINIITPIEDFYPALLRHIIHPPSVLYYRGAPLHSYGLALSVVGSRNSNFYGKRVIERIIPALVQENIAIVSGGAVGIDTMAHTTTIESQGRTIAVLGSGLLKPYPQSNKKLFERIYEQSGTIVSIFPLEAEPLAGHFPARNRVIAGLSRGCLVVQAAKKSGALITAQYALEQSRDVFAVPGPFDNELSQGCHMLIHQGARLVTSVEDIFHEWNIYPAQKQALAKNTNSIALSDVAVSIIQYCESEPCTIDDILEKTGKDIGHISSLLFDLQVKGILAQTGAGIWEKVG